MNLKHPSLLMLMTGAAAVSMLSHGMSASFAAESKRAPAAATTRLGSAIQTEMADRDGAASQRSRALELRERAMKASEKRLEANVQAQQKQAAKPVAATPTAQEAEGATLDQLARIYQSMKAKQAARVFERLEINVQVGVARKMRERSTAQILAAMTPDGAARLSMALASDTPRRQPALRSQSALPPRTAQQPHPRKRPTIPAG